jgi:hypothetical protein
MKWVLIKRTYVNIDTVTAFKWADGDLAVFFVGEIRPTEWEDPGKQLYKKLCSDMGLNAYEECIDG